MSDLSARPSRQLLRRIHSRIGWIVLTSQVVSLLFSPFYLPVVAFAALFTFSYLNMLPLLTKLLL